MHLKLRGYLCKLFFLLCLETGLARRNGWCVSDVTNETNMNLYHNSIKIVVTFK